MTGRLEGKVAVITGGAGALGRNVAELLLHEGAKVALVDIDEQALKEQVSRLENKGQVIGLTSDLSSEEDVAAYVGQVVENWEESMCF